MQFFDSRSIPENSVRVKNCPQPAYWHPIWASLGRLQHPKNHISSILKDGLQIDFFNRTVKIHPFFDVLKMIEHQTFRSRYISC